MTIQTTYGSDFYAPGETHSLIEPRIVNSLRGAIFCHGANRPGSDGANRLATYGDIARAIGEDRPCMYPDLGGPYNWGAPLAKARFTDAKAYLVSKGASSGKIIIAAASMGTAVACNWARANPSLVQALLLFIPAVDIEDFRANDRAGMQSEIEDAYNGTLYHRPVADTSNPSNWTNPAYPFMDTDGDGEAASTTPASSGTGSTLEVKLTTNIPDPVMSTGHVLKVRALKTNSNRTVTLNWALYCGATLIVSGGTGGLSTAYSDIINHTLTGLQADAITDYADLRVQLAQVVTGGVSGTTGVSVSSVRLARPASRGWTTEKATHNPIEYAAADLAGKGFDIKVYYSSDDPSCLPALVESFISLAGAQSQNLGPVGHDVTGLDLAEVRSWLAARD